MTHKPAKPAMHDPADTDIHQGAKPYPTPAKSKVERSKPADDLEDPARTDPDAPHDRGFVRNGRYEDATDDMLRKTKEDGDLKAWKKGQSQSKL